MTPVLFFVTVWQKTLLLQKRMRTVRNLRQPSLMLWNIWQNRLQEMVRDVLVFLKLPVMEQLQRKMQRLSVSLLYVLL